MRACHALFQRGCRKGLLVLEDKRKTLTHTDKILTRGCRETESSKNNHPLLPMVIAIVALKYARGEQARQGKEGWRDYLDMAFNAAEVHRVGAYML
jgi:hypothetical protein